jgi:hypothetical protein
MFSTWTNFTSLFISTLQSGSVAGPRRWPHRRRNRSDLIAVSLRHSRSDKPFASFTTRARAMGRAPIRKCVRVDVNTHNDVSVSLESAFHFLGNLQPLFPSPWHLDAIVENFQQRRIIFLFDPIGSDRWRWLVLKVGHMTLPANVIAGSARYCSASGKPARWNNCFVTGVQPRKIRCRKTFRARPDRVAADRRSARTLADPRKTRKPPTTAFRKPKNLHRLQPR